MISIQDARDLLFASKEKAVMIYEEEDQSAHQAIDYLFILMDIELIKLQKVKEDKQ
jgi:hypothetical protein